MAELINKREAIKEIEQERDPWPELDWDRGRNMGLSVAAKAVESMPPMTLWVPCSERMPEEQDAGIMKKFGIQLMSKKVLITIESNGEKAVDNNAHTRDGEWHSSFLQFLKAGGKECRVTAWMPMPEPYEEKINGSD